MALTRNDWEKIRERFELGDSVTGIAKDFSISCQALYKRSAAEKWLNPRMIARRARAKLVTRNAAIIENEEDRLMQRFVEAKEHLSVASLHAIKQFRESVESGQGPAVSDWKEILNIVATLEKVTGLTEESKEPRPAQQNLFLDYQLLASRPSREELIARAKAVRAKNPCLDV